MKTRVILLLVFFTCFLFLVKEVNADVINPEYYTKKCSSGELEITCSYKSIEPFGPKTYNECAPYENNPKYRFLTGNGHSFGGSSKYCYSSGSIIPDATYLISKIFPAFVVTFFLELVVFYISGFRTKKDILGVLIVNLVSVFFANWIISFIFISLNKILFTLIVEILIIIFEAFFWKFWVPKTNSARIIKTVVIANLTSFVLGTIIFSILQMFPSLLLSIISAYESR